MTPPVYYTSKLTHIGIIPDGGRRWAKANSVSLTESYANTNEKLLQYIDACYGWGIATISIYLLSKKNLARPATDLEAAIEFVITFLEATLGTLYKCWHPAVKIAGNLDCIPLSLKNTISKYNQTSPNETRRLYLCVAYDPWDEIALTLQRMERYENGDKLIRGLWVSEPVDLVIRTGGSRSLSHFLPLQCSYATLAFLDKLFNDTTVLDIFTTIRHYDEEEHRLGL